MGRPKFKSWHPITVTGLTDLRLIAQVRFVFSAKIRFSGEVGKSMPKISEFSHVNYCKFLVTLKFRWDIPDWNAPQITSYTIKMFTKMKHFLGHILEMKLSKFGQI